MTASPSLDTALQRLAAALSRIEDAVERRIEADRVGASREVEVQALSDDRARLAQELDESFARCARAEAANRDVSRRLDQAIDTIRTVLEHQDP
ncbi:DUF4164 domain-containing protein [Labrys wisconsinensis]|uniref:Exonuclease VII small subunit n=1 Tax=Labrys wisconsinensis TaxID=425677 RepID=A0ABU0JFI3_9HYPH|nr:DUF4164 domain-containing protein [Labrys wisconsinensis]MDQ0472019.1 exonuclease VII small subunit [Labrys wisconsinensis]